MIAKCQHGPSFGGLVKYLVGAGKRNEHTFPHVVAGHDAVTSAVGHDGELSRDDAATIAGELDLPRKVFGTQVLVDKKKWSEDLQRRERTGQKVPGHVYHVSLSAAPEDGVLTDATWRKIAEEYVAGMGFAGDAVTGAQCRWVAVRHGVSANGNDHVHIAVNLVREDGTKANIHRDYVTSRRVVNGIERRLGLRVLDSTRRKANGLGANTQAEIVKAERAQMPATARDELRRRVSAVAVAANSEREFLDGLRDARVLVRPRFAKDSLSQIVGYSVALVPGQTSGQRSSPVWYAPSKLDRTLGLGHLRQRWGAKVTGDPEQARVWRARWRARDVADTVNVRAAPEVATAALAKFNERMSSRQARVAAADLAGILNRASIVEEKGTHGPLARAAQEYARAAQPGERDRGSEARAAMQGVLAATYRARLTARATGTSTGVGWIAVLRQAQRTAYAVAGTLTARGREQEMARARMHAAAAFGSVPALQRVDSLKAPSPASREATHPVATSRRAPTAVHPGREGGVEVSRDQTAACDR